MTILAANALLAEFAPKGVLRVALNHGNHVLVGRDAQGAPRGITPLIAQALAQHLGVDLRFVEYGRAADAANDAAREAWDICFLAVDPMRAQTIDFTKPYLQIEGRYLAGPAVSAADAAALVAEGNPVGSVEGSAYTLTLQRKPGAEHLVIFKEFQSMIAAFDAGDIAAIAGIGAVMQAKAAERPGTRVLNPPFMQIRQAMGMPVGRTRAKPLLDGWLDTVVRDGTIEEILVQNGVDRSCLVA